MKALKIIFIIVLILALITGIGATVVTMSGLFEKEPQPGDIFELQINEELRQVLDGVEDSDMNFKLIIVDEEYAVAFVSATFDGEFGVSCEGFRYEFISEDDKDMIRICDVADEDENVLYLDVDMKEKTCTMNISLSDLD